MELSSNPTREGASGSGVDLGFIFLIVMRILARKGLSSYLGQ